MLTFFSPHPKGLTSGQFIQSATLSLTLNPSLTPLPPHTLRQHIDINLTYDSEDDHTTLIDLSPSPPCHTSSEQAIMILDDEDEPVGPVPHHHLIPPTNTNNTSSES